MDPTIPENHFVDFEPEPIKALPYTGPKVMRTLVAGKPDNRRYRRAEAAFNKKARELAKKTAQRALSAKNDVLGKMERAQAALDPLLQTSPEAASEPAPSSESTT